MWVSLPSKNNPSSTETSHGLLVSHNRGLLHLDFLFRDLEEGSRCAQGEESKRTSWILRATILGFHIMDSHGLCNWYSQPTPIFLHNSYSSRCWLTLRFCLISYVGRHAPTTKCMRNTNRIGPADMLWHWNACATQEGSDRLNSSKCVE